MKKFLCLLGLAALVAVEGCAPGEAKDQAPAGKVTNVEVYTVVPTTFVEHISLPAVVVPNRQADLSLVGGGRVARVLVDKGDRVVAGQILLETETEMLRAAHDLAVASLEFQTGEFQRAQSLFQTGSINESAFGAAKLAFAQAQSQRDISRKQLRDATLRAPFAGTVALRHVEVGDVLGPGSPAFRLIDVDPVRIQVGIPERLIGDFRTGNTVSVALDALPGTPLLGRLDYLSPEATSSVRTFLAEIVIPNADGAVRAGIMGNARIQGRTFENALLMPMDALIESQAGRRVFVVRDDTLAAERPIAIAASDETMVVVTDGVRAGDQVVTKGQHDIVNGDRVRITGQYRPGAGVEVSAR